MGEISDLMLSGAMDPETGEWNFDGEDGPGFPMTGAEAAAFKRATRWKSRGPKEPYDGSYSAYKLTKAWRKKIEAFGDLRQNDAYHWQVRADGKVIADWWPHKSKWRIDGTARRGNEGDFVRALAKATGPGQ